jgi:predicted protein tyrosine phosphatase
MSRGKFEGVEFDSNTAIISIGDPGSSTPRKCNNFQSVLRLEFLDIDLLTQRKNIFELLVFKYKILGFLIKYFDRSFSVSDAGRVIDFVQRSLEKNIVVHCDYGKSRSVAVTKYILSNEKWKYVYSGQNKLLVGNQWVKYLLEEISPI